VELGMPVLLVLGLATRFSALMLFVFNIVATISYPGLNEIGIKDHQHWGLLLLVPLFHGAGRLSLDQLIMGRLRRKTGGPESGNKTDILAPATERY
jgi:putative oxidoreductase